MMGYRIKKIIAILFCRGCKLIKKENRGVIKRCTNCGHLSLDDYPFYNCMCKCRKMPKRKCD